MPQECKDKERETQRAGDSYYNAITTWLTDRKRSDEQRQRAFSFARIYHRSLYLFRACLERLRHRPAARRKLDHAVELQQLLEKDMQVLAPSTASAGDES